MIATSKNCIHCGALLVGNKCEYCGAEYGLSGAIDSYCGEITVDGETIRCYISEIKVDVVRGFEMHDVFGRLMRSADTRKRVITLVEV